jgi:hypothetical protein
MSCKVAYSFQIPRLTNYEDFEVLQYLSPLALKDTIGFAIIVFLQLVICLWIGYIINKLEIIEHYSLIPSTVSALILSIFTTFFRWNGFYFVLLLSLLAITIIIQINKEKVSHYHCFFAGICQGCMTLIMPTAIIGLPFLHWALYTSKKQGIRGYALIYIGFLLPFYFFYAGLYILGQKILPIQYILDAFGYFSGYIELQDRFVIFPLLLATLISGTLINVVMTKLVFGKRQMVRVLLFYGIGLLLMAPLFISTQTSVFLLWTFPITLIISILLLKIKKTLPIEIAFGIFVIGIIILSILKI